MRRGSRKFKKVAVLKGGPSAERDVSLRSGAAVAAGLRQAGYEVSEIDITGHSVNLPAGVEAVFVALHGEFGEDGRVQRILEAKGIPYTGSGPGASAAAFDKRRAKEALLKAHVPTPAYEVLKRGDSRKLPLPVVVKPPCQGSSLGVYRVFRRSQWNAAARGAFKYDDEILVEKYIKGRELTVGIVGDTVLPVVEIKARAGWYSFNAKYGSRDTR
ncbi:MAG: D-alanine--D-alanine ligase, partial [bacterium]